MKNRSGRPARRQSAIDTSEDDKDRNQVSTGHLQYYS